MLRRSFNLVERELAEVESARIASSVDEYLAAMKLNLVHDGYVHRGIMTPHGAGVRMTPYLALNSSTVFVALESGKVEGTISLVKDGELGLPMEKIYSEEINALRAKGLQLAEVGALSVSLNKRGSGMAFLLNKTMLLAALQLLDVDELVIAVHPDVADFYSGVLLFETMGPVHSYPSLGREALAVAMRLNVKTLREAYRSRWSRLPKNAANPYWLYFERNDRQIQLPTTPAELATLHAVHSKAAMKLVALRPDVVLELSGVEFAAMLRAAGATS